MQTSLSKIVAQFLNSADRSSNEFTRCINLAIRGLENEFNLDICGQFKTVMLDVETNKTVVLPIDYINYSKIGIVNNIGEFVCLKRNDQMSGYHAIYLGEDNRNAGVPVINSFVNPFALNQYPYSSNWWFNYWANGSGFHLYGLDSGTRTIGTYKIEMGDNCILLNPDFAYPQILLEYLCDGYDEGEGDYMVDSRTAEALLAWVRWQAAIDKPNKYNQGTIMMYRAEYFNEKRKAKMRVNGFNLAEFNDVIRRGTKLVPKA